MVVSVPGTVSTVPGSVAWKSTLMGKSRHGLDKWHVHEALHRTLALTPELHSENVRPGNLF